MPAGWQEKSEAPFQMIVKFKPGALGIMKPVTNPETGIIARTYYRAMSYVKMWNQIEPQYHHALYIPTPNRKTQKKFDLDAEAWYGYEDIEL